MKELFDRVSVPPKVSVWITVACFCFVIANNYFYLSSVQEREKKVRDDESRIELKEAGNTKKERMMRLWELELLTREKELTKLLEEIKVQQKRPSN